MSTTTMIITSPQKTFHVDHYPFGRYKINDSEILNILIESLTCSHQQEQIVLEKNYNQIPGLLGLSTINHHHVNDHNQHEENSKIITFWNCWYNQEDETNPSSPILHPFSQLLTTDSHPMNSNNNINNNNIEHCEIISNLLFICIMHGGYFSGGIFDFESGKCLVHKTFSNYVSRKKQGGRQLSHDIQTGHKAKSAGSEIRRNQEKQFQEKLHTLFTQHWRRYFVEGFPVTSSLSENMQSNKKNQQELPRSELNTTTIASNVTFQKVFASMVYCPGSLNRDMIENLLWNELGAKNIPIRNVPFQVPKPNFMNLLTTFEKLCSVHICSRKEELLLKNDEWMNHGDLNSISLLRNLSENSSTDEEEQVSSHDEEEDNTSDAKIRKEQRLTEEYLRNYPSPLSPLSSSNEDHAENFIQSPKSPLSPLLQFFGFTDKHSSTTTSTTRPVHRSNKNNIGLNSTLNQGQPILYSTMKKNHSKKKSKKGIDLKTIEQYRNETEMRQQSLLIWGGIFALAAATMAIYIWNFAESSSNNDDYY
ncbi:hypothetical protein FDP41_006707 [Naegleria fowleri]|uniref:VLRF1 domain-containing protein n=1 Tax=Naegleria fowleri TaxID=5763 RepID=A0A6A5BA28_NAEFO|nr:uncharacterized protein FDP41_006707 [Naegleria fowleri]KAF0974097.1 hypothetical protein FDP41_006707 [Naegleria fowleri]CAG4710142.1 unnamed protein product [Naegleria fowleri]